MRCIRHNLPFVLAIICSNILALMLSHKKETSVVKVTRQNVGGYCIHTCRLTQRVHRHTALKCLFWPTARSLVQQVKAVKSSEDSDLFVSDFIATNIRSAVRNRISCHNSTPKWKGYYAHPWQAESNKALYFNPLLTHYGEEPWVSSFNAVWSNISWWRYIDLFHWQYPQTHFFNSNDVLETSFCLSPQVKLNLNDTVTFYISILHLEQNFNILVIANIYH